MWNCDKTAEILLQKLKKREIHVPEDVSVVGFDNYNTRNLTPLKLTTYENDEKAIAQISVNTILKRIEGRKKPSGVRIVGGSIVLGNTVRRKGDL